MLVPLAPLVPLVPALVALIARVATAPHPIDDAYITFRYAQNLATGAGLVYNPGEAVLGTTAPLWALILALGRLLGFADLPWLATVLSALCDAASAALLVLCARQLGLGPLASLLVGLAWALNPMSVAFATGGMETSLFVLLALTVLSLVSRGLVRLDRDTPELDRYAAELDRDTARLDRDASGLDRDASGLDRYAVQMERGTAERRRDAVTEKRDTGLAERDTALSARDTALLGRDTARPKRDTAPGGRDTAARERDTARADRDAALCGRDTAAVGRDNARTDRDTATAPRQVLVAAAAAGVATFVRPEGALLAATVVLCAAVRWRRLPWQAMLAAGVPMAHGAAALTLVYGSPLPHSVAAKQVAYAPVGPLENPLAMLLQAGLPGWSTFLLAAWPPAACAAAALIGLVVLFATALRDAPRTTRQSTPAQRPSITPGQCQGITPAQRQGITPPQLYDDMPPVRQASQSARSQRVETTTSDATPPQPRRRGLPYLPFAVFTALFVAFYIVAGLRGVRLFSWYLVPIAPVYLLTLARGLASIGSRPPTWPRAATAWQMPATALAALLVGWQLSTVDWHQPLLPAGDSLVREQLFIAAGSELRDTLPPTRRSPHPRLAPSATRLACASWTRSASFRRAHWRITRCPLISS